MLRKDKIAFARKAAAEGMVLLKNNNKTLPICKEDEISLFGIASYKCFRLGWGSGDMMAQQISQISDSLIEAGFILNNEVKNACEKWISEQNIDYFTINRNWDEWSFRMKEIELNEDVVKSAATTSKLAIITIGRCSGEAADLKDEEGFFRLHSEEINLVEMVSKYFDKIVLLLNTCGPLDLRSIDKFNIDSIVDVSLGGQEFGRAVTDLLSGKITPCGKLTTTWAYKYDDYPTKEGITEIEVPYNEGIYVGYRYFDTFNVVPRYPFGFGLSYTTFELDVQDITLDGQIIDVIVRVKNTGDTYGKEVVQCYLSAPEFKLEKSYQDLCAYTKTGVINSGDYEDVSLSFDITDMASYDEERALYVLEQGRYYVRIGNSSRNTHIAFAIDIQQEVICATTKNRLIPKEKINILSNKGIKPFTYPDEELEKNNTKFFVLNYDSIENEIYFEIETKKVEQLSLKDANNTYTLEDVVNGKVQLEDVVAQFSNEELGFVLNGVIYEGANATANVGSMAIKVRGAAGELWSSEKYKIPVNACADGPAGVRLAIFGTPVETDTDIAKNVVAYPSGTCLANSWDLESARKFGECIASDLEYADIEGWLAPGINIQRNPLNGRNFEYLSEDPLISGKIGAYVTIGVQYDKDANPTGKYTTVKHFACNNIEYERGVSNSKVTERALREIYLKGFKIAVEEGNPGAIMTAYNKINGEFASTNYDLLMGILRGEWEYDGIVMTDWNTCADATKHTHAGNDLIMPGRFAKEIKEAIDFGKIKKTEAQLCATRILNLILKTSFKYTK